MALAPTDTQTSDPLFEIAVTTSTTIAVPDALRGRVVSLQRLVELGAYGLGFFVTGMLLQIAGSAVTIVFLSGILCALTLFAWINPAFRTLRPRETTG